MSEIAITHRIPSPVPAGRFGKSEDDAIDQALMTVENRLNEISIELGLPKRSHSLADLRKSPLGTDLAFLSRIGLGREDGTPRDVRQRVRRILALLLDPIAIDNLAAPAWFWQTSIGTILSSALVKTYPSGDLVNCSAAAERLEVPIGTVAEWIANGSLEAITDEHGATWISLATIERMREIARELEPRCLHQTRRTNSRPREILSLGDDGSFASFGIELDL